MSAFTVLCDGTEHVVDIAAERQTVTRADFEAATGWRVEEQGLCRGDLCMPVATADVLDGGRVDIAAVAAATGRPWVVEPAAHAGVLGEAAVTRSSALTSLHAPEFALPDLDGRVHRLSQYRGRKVLLAAYASW